MDKNSHYVYLYRDTIGNPIYVGYGRHARRSSAHIGTHAHNAALTRKLKQGYTLEIAGPFGDKDKASAVETALISALMLGATLTNKNKGHHGWRFRPMGVPQRFVTRLDEPPLSDVELRAICRATNGILFVIINDKDLSDGRPGDVLANAPTDAEIAERMDRWWQLFGRASQDWVPDPTASPGLLVALGGTGDFRIVIGSLAIDKNGWGDAVKGRKTGGLLTVPHAKQLKNLDELKLRGRRIDSAMGLRFGALRHQVFILLNGQRQWIAGGNKTLRDKGSSGTFLG